MYFRGSEYGPSQYGPAGYHLGYDRAAAPGGGGQVASVTRRELETMSTSSGSVKARRRSSRQLEQVNEGEDESTDSRADDDRSLNRRGDRNRPNSRLGKWREQAL